jgi:hypothetical protein
MAKQLARARTRQCRLTENAAVTRFSQATNEMKSPAPGKKIAPANRGKSHFRKNQDHVSNTIMAPWPQQLF